MPRSKHRDVWRAGGTPPGIALIRLPLFRCRNNNPEDDSSERDPVLDPREMRFRFGGSWGTQLVLEEAAGCPEVNELNENKRRIPRLGGRSNRSPGVFLEF